MKKVIAALLSLLLVSVLTGSAFADIAPLPDEEYERIFGSFDPVEVIEETEPEPEPEPETELETEPEKEETSAPAPEPAEIKPFPSPSQIPLIVTMAVAVVVIAGAVLWRTVVVKKEGAK